MARHVRIPAAGLIIGDAVIANSGRAKRITAITVDLDGVHLVYSDGTGDQFDPFYDALLVR